MFGIHRTGRRLFALRACFIIAILAFGGLQSTAAQDPTAVPTDAPTEIPTEVPTEIPTEVPTQVPTESPTAVPTEAPTETPVPTSEPVVTRVLVSAVLCDDASCETFGERLIGFEITAVDVFGGAALDTCAVQGGVQIPSCLLVMPGDPTFELTWDPAQMPDGYVPFSHPIHVDGGPGPAITYLGFYPADQVEPVAVVVQAALCVDASCDMFETFLDDFTIVAVDAHTGEEYDRCVTGTELQDEGFRCILEIPPAVDFELEWDPDEVPDGYEPFGELIPVGEPVMLTLAFVPDDDGKTPAPTPTDVPVTKLPDTGSGATGDRWTGPAMATVAVLLIGAALGASALQRSHR
jgi:hypothetical protein